MNVRQALTYLQTCERIDESLIHNNTMREAVAINFANYASQSFSFPEKKYRLL